MNATNVFNNHYCIPHPKNSDDIEQLYRFKDALEAKAKERDDKYLQYLQRRSTKS